MGVCTSYNYAVYPNPADDQLTVEQTDSTGAATGTQRRAATAYSPAGTTAAATSSATTSSTPFTVRVYDNYGTLRLQQTVTTSTIDLSTTNLPTGLYAVTIEAGGTIVTTQHVQISH